MDDSVKEVGGLDGLRKWLNEKKTLLTPEKRDEMKALGLQSPRGILLVGVPGCGKSMSAKAIAANWKMPLYRLDFATVQGQYVGQSEQQLKDALTTAENVSPCVLWIDEIEKDWPVREIAGMAAFPREWWDSFCSGFRNAKTGLRCGYGERCFDAAVGTAAKRKI
ncbi:MAG: AAA family ATPase [Frisingicoccus sp.]